MKNAALCEDILHEIEGDWLEQDQVAEVLDALVVVVLRKTAAGEKVHLREFGTFRKSFMESRTVKFKGKEYFVPEHNRLEFTAENEANDELNQE